MKKTCTQFALFALALSAVAVNAENAFAQKKGAAPVRTVAPTVRRVAPGPAVITNIVPNRVIVDGVNVNAERLKLLQDTQTQLFAIGQDVTVNRASTVDKSFRSFEEFVRPDRRVITNVKGVPAARIRR